MNNCIAIGFFLPVFLLFNSCQMLRSSDQVCFGEKCFKVELAMSAQEKQRGLQFREALSSDAGMMFIFSEQGRHSFWMKDTFIPLDIIWLDANKRVVHVENNMPPCRREECPAYTPAENALYVLELNGGTAQRIGLKTGSRLDFRFRKSTP